MFPECKKLLQLSPYTKVKDWYLFQYHTEIRIYGVEVQPFMLPKFLTIRIFDLEYIRQRFNFDYIHVASKKQKVTFKFKREVGPFIVNTTTVFQVVENILQ